MNFIDTPLSGVFLLEISPLGDERGFFARTWCHDEFAKRELSTRIVQCNVSFNERRGTLRGMHFQLRPRSETKIVRCTRGRVYDVTVDLRPNSPTFRRWWGVELSEQNHRMVYIPVGCAHGFQTLVDNTEMFYQMSEIYDAALACGIRWDDPAIGIRWPLAEGLIISEKDQSYPSIQVEG